MCGDIDFGVHDGPCTHNGAVRTERFEHFGSTVKCKFTAGAQVVDGSRAPTPCRQNAFNVSTIFDAIGQKSSRPPSPPLDLQECPPGCLVIGDPLQ